MSYCVYYIVSYTYDAIDALLMDSMTLIILKPFAFKTWCNHTSLMTSGSIWENLSPSDDLLEV